MRVVFPEAGIEVAVELETSPLSEKIQKGLPVSARVDTWGKEIYFEIPVRSDIVNPQETVRPGDVAYWPQGACLCFFFGATPASRTPDEIRPASPVEVIGRIKGDVKILETIPSGTRVEVYDQ
ncbi:MAG TPA: cyclophilin-like fold protein [Atribacteraceae bacterium]|nr:cyclophilin-like fold protein [Atribacteraceae bacterium]